MPSRALSFEFATLEKLRGLRPREEDLLNESRSTGSVADNNGSIGQSRQLVRGRSETF